MKKFLLFSLALIMLLAFIACGPGGIPLEVLISEGSGGNADAAIVVKDADGNAITKDDNTSTAMKEVYFVVPGTDVTLEATPTEDFKNYTVDSTEYTNPITTITIPQDAEKVSVGVNFYGVDDNHPPQIPANPTPADSGTSTLYKNIPLTWESSDADGDDLTYDIYWATQADGLGAKPDKYGCEDMYYTIKEEFTPGTAYVWKVVVTDGIDTVEGPEWTFTVDADAKAGPDVPSDPQPRHTEKMIEPNLANLTWTGTDPDADLDHFDVKIATTEADLETATAVSTANATASIPLTDFTALSLELNGTYYWQVTAVDAEGNSTTGPVWKFETVKTFDLTTGIIDPADSEATFSTGTIKVYDASDDSEITTLTGIREDTNIYFELESLDAGYTFTKWGGAADGVELSGGPNDRSNSMSLIEDSYVTAVVYADREFETVEHKFEDDWAYDELFYDILGVKLYEAYNDSTQSITLDALDQYGDLFTWTGGAFTTELQGWSYNDTTGEWSELDISGEVTMNVATPYDFSGGADTLTSEITFDVNITAADVDSRTASIIFTYDMGTPADETDDIVIETDRFTIYKQSVMSGFKVETASAVHQTGTSFDITVTPVDQFGNDFNYTGNATLSAWKYDDSGAATGTLTNGGTQAFTGSLITIANVSYDTEEKILLKMIDDSDSDITGFTPMEFVGTDPALTSFDVAITGSPVSVAYFEEFEITVTMKDQFGADFTDSTNPTYFMIETNTSGIGFDAWITADERNEDIGYIFEIPAGQSSVTFTDGGTDYSGGGYVYSTSEGAATGVELEVTHIEKEPDGYYYGLASGKTATTFDVDEVTYDINLADDGNATITPNSFIGVDPTQTLTFTVVPDTDFRIKKWEGFGDENGDNKLDITPFFKETGNPDEYELVVDDIKYSQVQLATKWYDDFELITEADDPYPTQFDFPESFEGPDTDFANLNSGIGWEADTMDNIGDSPDEITPTAPVITTDMDKDGLKSVKFGGFSGNENQNNRSILREEFEIDEPKLFKFSLYIEGTNADDTIFVLFANGENVGQWNKPSDPADPANVTWNAIKEDWTELTILLIPNDENKVELEFHFIPMAGVTDATSVYIDELKVEPIVMEPDGVWEYTDGTAESRTIPANTTELYEMPTTVGNTYEISLTDMEAGGGETGDLIILITDEYGMYYRDANGSAIGTEGVDSSYSPADPATWTATGGVCYIQVTEYVDYGVESGDATYTVTTTKK